MTRESTDTQNKILSAAKREFLAKGFRAASLRGIVKEAGVTTGAFYGYYDSKEALFRDLVELQASTYLAKFKEAHDTFASLPPCEQKNDIYKISDNWVNWMIDYVYANFDAFRLLLCSSEGTEYSEFIHKISEIEVQSIKDFALVLEELGCQKFIMDDYLMHILVSGFFSALFETVVHDMPKEKASSYIRELKTFYSAGWEKIMDY